MANLGVFIAQPSTCVDTPLPAAISRTKNKTFKFIANDVPSTFNGSTHNRV